MADKRRLDSKGKEVLDTTPIAMPAGFKKPPSLHDQIRRLVRHESYQRLMETGEVDSLEEADDLDVGDEDPLSPWEHDADHHDLRQTYRDEIRSARRKKDEDEFVARFSKKPSKASKKSKVETSDVDEGDTE